MVLIVNGKVTSGQGVAKDFIALDWVRNQIKKKFGFAPFHGTLNLSINEEMSISYWKFIESHDGIQIQSLGASSSSGKCFKTRINDVDSIVVVPLVPNYPRDQIEVVAPINLRKKFNLHDGTEMTVIVYS